MASKEFGSARTVFLFVKAKSAGNVKKGLWWGVDHWIVLASSIEVRASVKDSWGDINSSALEGKDIDDYEIKFKAYTWGQSVEIGTNNASSTVKIDNVDDFIDYFYGYIAASHPNK